MDGAECGCHGRANREHFRAQLVSYSLKDDYCEKINRKMKLRHAGKMRDALRESLMRLCGGKWSFLPFAAFSFLAVLNFSVVTAERGEFHRVARPRHDHARRKRDAVADIRRRPVKKCPDANVPGLQIVQTGSSQNVSFINGPMSSTVTVSFQVTARQTGEFTIPALTADVNGQQLASAPLKLTVLKADAPTAAAD